MNKYILPAALVASALAATSASAVTIAVGEDYSEGFTVAAGATTSVTFTPASALTVQDLVVTGTDTKKGTSLAGVTFGIGSASTGYSSILAFGTTGIGYAYLGTFDVTDPFTLVVTNSSKTAVSFGYSFNTEAAPVPLPAAAPLLVAALGGLGIAARRKAKKAA